MCIGCCILGEMWLCQPAFEVGFGVLQLGSGWDLPDLYRNRGHWIWKRNEKKSHFEHLLHPKHCERSFLFELILLGNAALRKGAAMNVCLTASHTVNFIMSKWFSAGANTAPEGTFGKVWGHFSWSQLVEGTLLASGGWRPGVLLSTSDAQDGHQDRLSTLKATSAETEEWPCKQHPVTQQDP